MQVFVLGGTGSIGRSVVAELVRRKHRVVGLSRSETSDNTLAAIGAKPFRGDLLQPAQWVDAAVSADAIIQVAATFGDDMGDVDAKAMNALIGASNRQSEPTRLIYTGGCWLYGETGDDIATEDRRFDPLPPFAWMVHHAEMLLQAPKLNTAIIHPAMVYDMDTGGVFRRFLAAAQGNRPIEVWGNAATRWPLVHSRDLARAYCDLVPRADLAGHFNAAAENGVPVGQIAAAIASAYGSAPELVVRDTKDVMNEYGAWAQGPTLDQQMSSQKLHAATGWSPSVSDYTQPIADMVSGDSVMDD